MDESKISRAEFGRKLIPWLAIGFAGILVVRYALRVFSAAANMSQPPPFNSNAVVDTLSGEINEKSKGLMKLASVSVTDSHWENEGLLVVSFDYTVEFTGECWYLDDFLSKGNPLFDVYPKNAQDFPMSYATVGETKTYPLKGAFYHNNEKGWKKFPGWRTP